MLHLNKSIQKGVRFLLLRETDAAAYAQATRILCATVRCFHDTRAAAGHDSVAGVGERRAQVTGQPVVFMVLIEARGAEHGDAGRREVKTLEATQELEKDLYGAFQVSLATTSPRQEQLLGTCNLVEQGVAGWFLVRHGIHFIASRHERTAANCIGQSGAAAPKLSLSPGRSRTPVRPPRLSRSC
jgi:hypothetical protein